MEASGERAGVMVVRIWTEGSRGRLQARLTQTLDLASREESSHAAGSVEEILTIVRKWCEAFVAQEG
jgi:hypothetical protein